MAPTQTLLAVLLAVAVATPTSPHDTTGVAELSVGPARVSDSVSVAIPDAGLDYEPVMVEAAALQPFCLALTVAERGTPSAELLWEECFARGAYARGPRAPDGAHWRAVRGGPARVLTLTLTNLVPGSGDLRALARLTVESSPAAQAAPVK